MHVNEDTLIAMGYRPLDPQQRKWGKPVGKALLFYRDDIDTLQLHFRGAARTLLHSEIVVDAQAFDDVEGALLADASSFFQHGVNYAWLTK